MEARLVRVLDLAPASLESWGGLHERALEQSPFFEPPCVMAAARHLPNGDSIEVLLAEDGGEVVGCLPVRAVPRWHWSRRGTLTTNVRRLTWLGTPLLDRDRADEAMTAMLAHLRDVRRRSGGHMLAIEWMHAGGPAAGVLRRAAGALHLPLATGEEFERPGYLQLPVAAPGGEPAPVRRPRTTQKKRRRLAAQVGAVELVDRSADPGVAAELVALEADGYKAGAGIAMRTWPGEPEWFSAMCASFAAEGRLVALSVVAGDVVTATKVAVRAGDEVYLCVTTYDEAYAYGSPGIQLHYDTIDFLARAHVRRIDTCTYAGNDTEADIYPDRIPVATYLVGLGSPVERALLGALPAARQVRARVRARAH